jgi:ferric-dicitrate binding protein FerR (iron transport regulator)
MNAVSKNTFDTNTTRAARRRAAIAIVVALALGFAGVAALRAETNVTSGGIFASVSDYITEVGEALGGG